MIYNFIFLFIIWGVLAYFLSWGLNKYLISNRSAIIIKKSNDSAIRFASQTKPIYGGITFYTVFLIFTIMYIFFLDENLYADKQTFGIGFAVTVAFFMGLADDTLSTPPLFKFVVQLVVALLLVYFDVYISIFSNIYLNYIFTIIWIVGIMNSINMLDNMDAVTSVITLTILAGIFFNIGLTHDYTKLPFMFGIVVVFASILGFLRFNWSPSRIYMGDNGSQFLGALLGALSILFIWNPSTSANTGFVLKPILITLLAFIIPIVDTTTVTINRLLQGKSPFVGGRDHTTHHLAYLGLKDRNVVIVLGIISLISVSLSSYIVNFVNNWNIFYTLMSGSITTFIFIILYANTKVSKTKTRKFVKAVVRKNN